jgi:hypothetical protein
VAGAAIPAIIIFLPWALRDWLAFGSPFPGQALTNALSLDGRDIFAWSETPTLARYLDAGLGTLVGLRVTGFVHNLVSVLLLLGIPIGDPSIARMDGMGGRSELRLPRPCPQHCGPRDRRAAAIIVRPCLARSLTRPAAAPPSASEWPDRSPRCPAGQAAARADGRRKPAIIRSGQVRRGRDARLLPAWRSQPSLPQWRRRGHSARRQPGVSARLRALASTAHRQWPAAQPDPAVVWLGQSSARRGGRSSRSRSCPGSVVTAKASGGFETPRGLAAAASIRVRGARSSRRSTAE